MQAGAGAAMPPTAADIGAFLRDIRPNARGVPDIGPPGPGIVPAHVTPLLDGGAAAWHETPTPIGRLAGIPPTPPVTVPRPAAPPPSRKGAAPPARLPDDPQSAYERARGTFLFIEMVMVPAVAFALVYLLKRLR